MKTFEYVNGQEFGEGGGGSHPLVSPSFLVNNMNNVNSQLHRAQGLLMMWDFLEYKGRIGITNIICNKKDDLHTLKLMPASCHSRYFNEGRWHISKGIRKRLGKYNNVPGLMVTLTYDPKKTSKREAWSSFGKDTRAFINGVNQYRKRRGWRRLHYLWVVEVQKGTGYPHVHIFFPNLKWIAPINIMNGNWSKGRSNIGSPKKIRTNCAGYVSKYLRKMNGWLDLHLALLWSGHCRMYGFSRGFSVKEEKKESEWQRFGVIVSEDIEKLKQTLISGGYKIEDGKQMAVPN